MLLADAAGLFAGQKQDDQDTVLRIGSEIFFSSRWDCPWDQHTIYAYTTRLFCAVLRKYYVPDGQRVQARLLAIRHCPTDGLIAVVKGTWCHESHGLESDFEYVVPFAHFHFENV